MSLLDALLLEGYRDPRDIYIALRSDGQKGSGTIDDPYDGGTGLAPSLNASLTRPAPLDVFVFAPQLQSLFIGVGQWENLNPSQAAISGVTPMGALVFNGTKAITSVDFRTFKFTLTGEPGAAPAATDRIYATRPAPDFLTFPASLSWEVLATTPSPHGLVKADIVILTDDANPASVFNGPYAVNSVVANNQFTLRVPPIPWTTDPSSIRFQKVIHRFDEVLRAAPPYSAIHLGPGTFETRGSASLYVRLSGSEFVSDVGWQVQSGQKISGSGIGATTLKLVSAVDPSTQTQAVGSFNFVEQAEVSDLTVDCNLPGQLAPPGMAFAPVVCGAVGLMGRHLWIARVRAINFGTQSGPECFVLFLNNHYTRLGPNDTVHNVIENCIVEKPSENNTHETTLLASVGYAVSANARSPIVCHNYLNCTYIKTNGLSYSSEYVAVASITQQAAPNLELFELVTKRPHNRDSSNNVLISGVSASTPSMNGSFPVVQKVSETKLVFKVTGNAATVTGIGASKPYIGVDFHGPAALGGTGCVTEGNATFECANAFYTDTGSSRDAVVRDNYYSNVGLGVLFDFSPDGGGGASEVRTADTLTRDPNNEKMATLTIPVGAAALDVSVGDAVTVNGARIGNPSQPAPDGTYNGTYAVSWVAIDKRSFSYEMKSPVGSNANAPIVGFSINFQARWQMRRLVYENNVCDLYTFDSSSALAHWGMVSIGFAPTPVNIFAPGPPFMFPHAVIRENIFQHLDNAPAAVAANGVPSYAFRILSFENTAVERNLIGLSDPHLIHYVSSRNIHAFGNQAFDGSTLPFFEDVGGAGTFQEQDSLDSKVADAVLMSFL